MNRKVIVIIAVLVLILILGAALYVVNIKPGHRTLVVPDDYATIEWAVGNATDGDTVFVKEGIYYENLVIDKSISLIGESSMNTIIFGNGGRSGGQVINIVANYTTVSGFTIESRNESSLAYYADGIVTASYWAPQIIGNNIVNCGIGIVCSGSYATISGNNITANGNGAIRISGWKHTISGNNITSNYDNSITFDGSSDLCIISGNRIENSRWGIALYTGARYSVGHNTIKNCSVYGIGFYQTSSSYIFENNITDNTVGISFSQREDAAPMNYTNFYRNNLINNGQQVVIGVSNSINDWDVSELGNYWSDYTTKYPNATELDNTGIWNTPYVIDANNADGYPLLKPWEI